MVGGALKYFLASFPNVPLLDATMVIWLALAATASVLAVRIQGERKRKRAWLRDVRNGEWDDYAVESPAAFPNFGTIPPYLTARSGRYSGVLVHEDEDSGAREVLGRVE